MDFHLDRVHHVLATSDGTFIEKLLMVKIQIFISDSVNIRHCAHIILDLTEELRKYIQSNFRFYNTRFVSKREYFLNQF